MATVQKGPIMRSDFDNYDGTLATSRTDSSGGTETGLKPGDAVDVLQVYGSGDTANMTDATITTATSTLGSQNIALVFAPGTWTISNTITIASNFTVVVPAGCVFNVAASKTMTVAGIFFRQHATYSSGSGTFTISGTDLLASQDTTTHYAADTGSADTYVMAPSPTVASYAAGQLYAFLAANANTGASTLNVSSLGAKNLQKYDGTGSLVDLESGDILANQLIHCRYDGTQFQLIPNIQPPVNIARTDTDNTYTKTEIWKIGTDVASAAALGVDIDGNLFDVTGTTTITSMNSKGVGTIIVLQFDGALTLTHHATDLILPNGVNITTTAGDIGTFYEYASGDWRCMNYEYATGQPNAKGWVSYDQTGPTVNASYNVTSVTDTSAGDFTVNWATDFGSANYAVAGIAGLASASPRMNITENSGTRAAGTSRFVVESIDTLAKTDTPLNSIVAYGAQ